MRLLPGSEFFDAQQLNTDYLLSLSVAATPYTATHAATMRCNPTLQPYAAAHAATPHAIETVLRRTQA